jgi:hypothetical protein
MMRKHIQKKSIRMKENTATKRSQITTIIRARVRARARTRRTTTTRARKDTIIRKQATTTEVFIPVITVEAKNIEKV